MYCPHCGQQPPTEQTRYCTHCGFALNSLREFLNTGTLPGGSQQRDITLGAALMLAGTIKAIVLTASFSRGRTEIIAFFSLIEGAFLALLQLFFQFSPRQKGLSLGATLMFAAALAAMFLALPTEGAGAILVTLIAIPMILFWKRLTAGFSKLFFDKTEDDRQRNLPPVKPAVVLSSAQSLTIADLDTDRIATLEPASVIEGTTKSLRT